MREKADFYTIYKYELFNDGRNLVLTPPNSRIISAGLDGYDFLCIWAQVPITIVCTEDRMERIVKPATEKHYIEVFGTGWEFIDNGDLRFIDTVRDGVYMWHVFERMSGKDNNNKGDN